MSNKPILLGVDLGTSSIGWALLENDSGKYTGIIGGGARVFDAGLDEMAKDGKGKSRNVKRREARLIRRQLERRARRTIKVGTILQSMSLLPEGNIKDGPARHEYFKAIDAGLEESPYALRVRALNAELSPHDLGRALYHLAQRRGFASNRREAAKEDDKEKGKVKQAISELQAEIQENNCRTLGEFFSKLDPHENRIRERYTSRKMYLDEFDVIWKSQLEYHPDLLTDANYKTLHKAIFFQRPLKIQKHLIGMCELEEGKRRAPWALLSSQRFRYLQKLNDLRIVSSDGEYFDLESDQLELLAEELDTKPKMKFPAIRKALGLKNTIKFNFELGKEKDMPGNSTAARLSKIFGPRWGEFTPEQQDQVVEDIRSILKDETLKKRGMKHWGLDEEAAHKFSRVALEQGHCNFSKKALDKLVPMLQKGVQLQTAIKKIYPERWDISAQTYDELPPLNSGVLPGIRNPVVERSLTELRRVINAVIKKHGKPDTIRIELARDLKQSSKARGEAHKRNKENQTRREDAAKQITTELGIVDPTGIDIEKVMLANECRWECPYTGRSIKINALIGPSPQFDIEHIIPFSRSLDNSFTNKTLCYADENRHVKRGKTPHEAYSSDPKRWEEMLERVARFQGPISKAKTKRFGLHGEELDKLLDDFSSRQLNDTRYASKLAKQYLGLLYGGIKSDGIDPEGKRRVEAMGGGVTAHMRRALGLNSILGDGGQKSRDDHRHHMIDAICIALTGSATVKEINAASARAELESDRPFKEIAPPWDGFLSDVKDAASKTIVSRKVAKKVSGALHKETFYSAPYPKKIGSAETCVRIRKPLALLSNKEMQNIVDNRIREIVLGRMDELNITPKEFEKSENLPFHITKDNRKIPIRRVRVEVPGNAISSVGEGHRVRHVMPDSNHHVEVFVDIETGKWDVEVVSLFEAYRRKREKEPVVRRDHGPDREFLFSLFKKDVIELDCNGDWCEENCYFGYNARMREKNCSGGRRGLFVMKVIPESKQFVFAPINEAIIRKTNERNGLTAKPSALQRRNCSKKMITPLGEVRNASD